MRDPATRRPLLIPLLLCALMPICVIIPDCIFAPAALAEGPFSSQEGDRLLWHFKRHYSLVKRHPRRIELVRLADELAKASAAPYPKWKVFVFKGKKRRSMGKKERNLVATSDRKIFIWEALLEEFSDRNSMAVLFSHEMSHVLLGHRRLPSLSSANQSLHLYSSLAQPMIYAHRSTRSIAKNYGKLSAVASSRSYRQMLNRSFSHAKEVEADSMALFILARAGYNPELAIDFWSRAKNDRELYDKTKYFFIHRPTSERLDELLPLLERAKEIYRDPNPAKGDLTPSASPPTLRMRGDSFNLDLSSRFQTTD